jgi:Na+-driven multidrug efflux pump
LTLIISIVIPIILLVFLKDILYAMGAASVLTLATEYGQIVYRILCITI